MDDPIKLPALKDRIQDIPELSKFLIRKICNRINIDVLKIDAEGNYLWSQSYGGPESEEGKRDIIIGA